MSASVNPHPNVAIIGGGAWGLSLASLYHNANRNVVVYTNDAASLALHEKSGKHARVLRDIPLPALSVSNLPAALESSKFVLVAVRMQALRTRLKELKPYIPPSAHIILCCKGIETDSLAFPHEVAHAILPHHHISTLSGPSFATDVAQGLPTAVTLANQDVDLAIRLAKQLSTPNFRVYACDDIAGVEVGGSVKNVLAIACGVANGLGLGQSAHAALISRGFAELARLGMAMGGRLETLSGLSGLGDLVLTCSSEMSRNMRFGIQLGQGQSRSKIEETIQEVAEGVATSPSLSKLAEMHGIDMPICAQVSALLSGDIQAHEAAMTLLDRPIKVEG